MDQLVRRVDPHHRSLDQFYAEEVSQKFGNSYAQLQSSCLSSLTTYTFYLKYERWSISKYSWVYMYTWQWHNFQSLTNTHLCSRSSYLSLPSNIWASFVTVDPSVWNNLPLNQSILYCAVDHNLCLCKIKMCSWNVICPPRTALILVKRMIYMPITIFCAVVNPA